MNKPMAIAVLLCTSASVYGAISFSPVKNYPHVGLMFPILANAKADPVPMPEAQTYLLTDESSFEREDRFSPYELWYNNECCARWLDPSGNRLILARMTHRLPLFQETDISRMRFALALDEEANRLDPKKRAHINEWVATFVHATVYDPEPLKINRFTLDDLLFYPCDKSGTLIYAFRPRRVGNAKNFNWFCVILQTSGETDAESLRTSFEERFIGQIALPPRTSKDEGVQSREVSVPDEGTSTPDLPDQSVRRDALKSVENYDDWWFADADGYVILSDVHTSVGEALIRDLQKTLPALRDAYAKLVPPITPSRETSLIRLFQGREEYVRYVGQTHAWSSGMWMPGRRELVLFEQESQNEMKRIIRHEAFHQYLSFATGMLPVAPWLNEGHACLFENAGMNAQGKITIDEDPDRCPFLLENLETAVTLLPILLKADYEAFYTGTHAELRLKYALAWGLAYYLQKGAPLERNTPFKSILPDYMTALAQTRNGEKATDFAFRNVDTSVFQENFREFWLKRRNSALQYDPLDQ